MKKLFMTFLSIGVLCLLAEIAVAVPLAGYYEGWNVSGDLAGWGPNTIVSNTSVVDSGGNPNGYLHTDGNAYSSFDVGALSELSAVTGDYSGNVWTVSVDLSFISGGFDNAWLRFRYQDSTQNGWLIPLTNIFIPEWTSVSVTFDPSWSDETAMAHGWLTDRDAISPGANPSVAWSLNMSDVYTTEIRLSGEGRLTAGIDNFRLNTAAVPEPHSLLLFGAGVIGIAALRRKFTA